jgi:hypothetical protein
MPFDPADLWVIFFGGDREKIAAERCPRCGGALRWSPHIHNSPRIYSGVTQYPMGLSIYCTGRCNNMIGHLDGRAPEWALSVKDWEAFNNELRTGETA